MYGKDAAWAGLLASSVAIPMVHVSRQARYYSLTLMLCMACCLLIWRIYRKGRWRDYVGLAIAAGLLFHTHVLTFAIVAGASLMIVPAILRRGGDWRGRLCHRRGHRLRYRP